MTRIHTTELSTINLRIEGDRLMEMCNKDINMKEFQTQLSFMIYNIVYPNFAKVLRDSSVKANKLILFGDFQVFLNYQLKLTFVLMYIFFNSKWLPQLAQ